MSHKRWARASFAIGIVFGIACMTKSMPLYLSLVSGILIGIGANWGWKE